MKLLIGSHVSYKKENGLLGSVLEALSYGANTFMLYTGAPQNTIRSDIDLALVSQAKLKMVENNIDINNIIVHAPYIINLASKDEFSCSFLKKEMARCTILGLKYLVVHPGNSLSLTKEEAILNIAHNLKEVLIEYPKITICLETMSGKGTEVGSLSDLKSIIEQVNLPNLGLCLDTCHLSDYGYDISNFDNLLNEIIEMIGLDKIKCLHINDSKNIRGSKKDRHANIGFGEIGFNNLLSVIYHKKLTNIPKILETPYVKDDKNSYPPYKFEIEMIKKKEFNQELINNICKYYS